MVACLCRCYSPYSLCHEERVLKIIRGRDIPVFVLTLFFHNGNRVVAGNVERIVAKASASYL